MRTTAEPSVEIHTWRWREAQAFARMAYAAWRERGGAAAYAIYREAQDRADEAQDALAWLVQSRVRRT
jgi:hypothetical protein